MCGLSHLAGKTSMNLFSCTMAHHHTLHWVYMPGWIRSFRDFGWDDEDLTNDLQEVQISRPVTFSCGAGQRRRCTEQNLARWKNWRTDSERYHQRLTRLPAEDCEFHPRSFEDAGGCCRCLHYILSCVSIFPFKKVHIKIIFVIFALEM